MTLLALILTGNVSAEGEKSSSDWLKVITSAARQSNYSGVFVYQYDGNMQTSYISHVTRPGSEYEKIESLDGPRREIIRHNGQAWCITDQKVVELNDRLPRGGLSFALPEQLSELGVNYRVKELGMERVAGHTTRIILLKPRDNLRYARKIWAYSESGLPLKTAVLNDKNQVVEQYTFTQLKVGDQVDSSWVTSLNTPDLNSTNIKNATVEKSNKLINSGWVVDAVPFGFAKIMEIQRAMHGRHMPVTQLVFSDGLAAISVFIALLESGHNDMEGMSSRGAVNLYQKQIGNHIYTVVGEVPPRTVMQVLDSVRYNGK